MRSWPAGQPSGIVVPWPEPSSHCHLMCPVGRTGDHPQTVRQRLHLPDRFLLAGQRTTARHALVVDDDDLGGDDLAVAVEHRRDPVPRAVDRAALARAVTGGPQRRVGAVGVGFRVAEEHVQVRMLPARRGRRSGRHRRNARPRTPCGSCPTAPRQSTQAPHGPRGTATRQSWTGSALRHQRVGSVPSARPAGARIRATCTPRSRVPGRSDRVPAEVRFRWSPAPPA